MKKIFLAIIIAAVMGCCSFAGCSGEGKTDSAGSSPIKEGDMEKLRQCISNENLITGEPVNLANSPLTVDQKTTVKAPSNILKNVTTGVTDETKTISRNAEYGGGQYISKLFTEGLSRAAYGSEFSAFQNYIVEKGCTVKTLNVLAKAVFTSEAFNAFDLNRYETAICLYRAILSRDPSEEEIMKVKLGKISEAIDEITSGNEFNELLPAIQFGPYYWRGSSKTFWSGDEVYTSADFNRLVENASATKEVALPQGALVLVNGTLDIPSGYTVKTAGNPNHYVRFARIIRNNGSVTTMRVDSETTLQNIFVDGNRSEFDDKNQGGFNLEVTGKNVVIWGCRVGEHTGPVHSNPGSGRIYFGRNLVTQYSTGHTNGWADGIDMYGYNSLIEYNHVVDPTDGGIVIFRSQKDGANVTQNTIVRYNLLCNTGNSAYCGIDNEGVDMDGNGVADFSGTVIYENAIYTSYVAHMHMCITLSARPWTENYKRVANVSVYNNYTPEGCFVNTAGGLIVEGVINGTARGNQLVLHLGDWSANFMGKRAYSLNTESCEGGEYQSGHTDWPATTFISPYMDIEKEESFEITVAYIYEDFRDIPAEKFVWSIS